MSVKKVNTLECRFISQEQGTETHEFNVPDKIVGVSREVWECYSDDTINRHGDIGCAARVDERVVKWDLDRPLRVWATGDPDYIDVLWATLDRLSPLLGMTFSNTLSQDEADLMAWVGITRDEGPELLRSGNCVEASGCWSGRWDGSDRMTEVSIGVWTVDIEWIINAGLVDRRIEHVTLHELLHALVPLNHRDDPLSVINNINAPDWIELDPLEEALIRFHRNPAIEPGMTMDDARQVIVLEEDVLDYSATREAELTPIEMLGEAFRTFQNAGSATWRMEGGWRGARCEKSFGRADYTIGQFYSYRPNIIRFFGGSDRLFVFEDENWSREAGEWIKDPPELWQNTEWRTVYSNLHVLLASALYFGSDDDIRVSRVNRGQTRLRFTLYDTILKYDWFRSAELRGWIEIDDDTMEIVGYEMDWFFNVIGSNSCKQYRVTATEGEYGVQIDVPDHVYFGTTDDVRDAIDRINGPR